MAAPQTPAPSSQPPQPESAAPRVPGRPGPKPGTPRPPRAPEAPAGARSTAADVGASAPAPARPAAAGTAAPPASGPGLTVAPERAPNARLGRSPESLESTVPSTAASASAFKRAEPKEAWWVGTLPNGPIHTTTIGGISFPRQTDVVGQDSDGQTTRSSRPGAIVHLTASEVARVHKALSTKIVRAVRRPDGTVSRAQVYDVRGAPETRFTPMDGDEPLARYVFMQRVPEFDHAAE